MRKIICFREQNNNEKIQTRSFSGRSLIPMLLVFMIACFVLRMPNIEARAGEKGYCVATELYMRMGPGTEYDNIVIGDERVVLVKGQEVEILDEQPEWYYLKATFKDVEVTGYSYAVYIKKEAEYVAENSQENNDIATDKTETTLPDAGKVESEITEETASKTNVKVTTKLQPYAYDGVVIEEGAKLYSKAVLTSDELVDVTVGQLVRITGSTMKSRKRWYYVTVQAKDEVIEGYVQSNHVALLFSGEVDATVKDGGATIRKTPDKSGKKLKDGDGKAVSLNAGANIILISEVMSKGEKWFKTEFAYGDESLSGYVVASQVKFGRTVTVTEESEVESGDTENTGGETSSDVGGQAMVEVSNGLEAPKKVELKGSNAVISGAKGLSVKEQPGFASASLRDDSGLPIFLYDGHQIEAISHETLDGTDWYYIRLEYKGIEYYGYINGRYIDGVPELLGEVTASVGSLDDFTEQLKAEGFPKSYRKLLGALHEQFPKWKFEAFKTGLDWETVITAESEAGKNLLPNSKSLEWKSLIGDAYNWKNDNFTVYDGSYWVTASKAAVEYYMDPRNFLFPEGMFQFEVLAYKPSCQQLPGVENILKNTAMQGSSYSYVDTLGYKRDITYAETFLMAAEYSGVNPYHLASRAKQEVVVGISSFSNSATGTLAGFEGLFNFYNIGAYHSTVSGGAVKNGLNYARTGSSDSVFNQKCLFPWTSRFRSILGGALYIGNNYINRGQNTIYLQKFNVTDVNTYGHQYMANIEAPYAEGKKVYSAYESPEELEIVFSIPIYENMPDEAAPVPEKVLNPNNLLKSLEVTDAFGNVLSLTPGFDADSVEYNLIVGNEVSSVIIAAEPASGLSIVSGTGEKALEIGTNKLKLKVTAENGEKRKYTLYIVRE